MTSLPTRVDGVSSVFPVRGNHTMSEHRTHQIPPDIHPYLDTVADRLLSGHAAVMVGAGFSRNAVPFGSTHAFPDWSQLGDRFYERLYGHEPGPDRKYLQVPALAHEIEAAFGRPALNQMLRDAIPDRQHEPSQLHVKLLDLPWSDVFTTNYDTLLERACRSVISQRYDVVVNPEDLGHSTRARIVKLHGSLPSDRPFIVTDEDYRRYPRDFAPFVNTVRQALLENTLCLIGYSGDDPNFLQWIGWIHDTLGHGNSPKMYLIVLCPLSQSQKTLLDRRNIIPVEISDFSGVDGDHYQALERFLDYLHLRRTDNNRLDWPNTRDAVTTPNNMDDLAGLVVTWKLERQMYPEWVILPEDRRLALWRTTAGRTQKLPKEGALPGALDLEFAFELTWRVEKCLVPIFDNQAEFIEATLTRYWPVTVSGAKFAVLSLDAKDMQARGLTENDVRRRCHHLVLAMMRYYREEGLSDRWSDACDRIQAVLPSVSPEHAARFRYERALFALFALNLKELKIRLAEWTHDPARPFWAAKRAGLLAEIGQVGEAQRLLEQSLEAIRTKLNLTPTKTDYTLVSQESFVMFLLHAVRHLSLLTAAAASDIQRQRQEFRERWHALRQYKCDPWQEVEVFAHKLDRPAVPRSDVTEIPTFDIGRVVRTHHFGKWDEEALTAYNFLRFCEDAGIPFRMAGCTIATKSAAGTLPRIAEYSSYWALATLVRIDDAKAVDEIFDRASLARLDTRFVDSLVKRYGESLRSAVSDIETGNWGHDGNFGTLLARILPEILSRLCCKCSRAAQDKLLDLLLEVYQSEQRGRFQGIRHLTERLLTAIPIHERVAVIPKLLQFPILGDTEPEYVNPFEFFPLAGSQTLEGPTIDDKAFDVFFANASSHDLATRSWAVTTLGKLHELELLSAAQSEQFGNVLWGQTGEDGMPAGTNYYRHAFLDLPHPVKIDPVALFMKYVRGARFPAQESTTPISIEFGGIPGGALCHEIKDSKNVPWSDNDVRSIVRRLVEWWDADKGNLKRMDVPGPFPSIADAFKKRLSALVGTLTAMIVRRTDSLDDENTRKTLKRVIEECSEHKLPALAAEMACVSLFPEWRERVLHRVEDEMTSTRDEVVIDALTAILVVSERAAADTEREDMMRLLRSASHMVRWRRKPVISVTISTVRDVLGRHPWAFADDIQRSVLLGLHRLIGDTAVHRTSVAGSDENENPKEVSAKLSVRRSAASLAYRLFEHYRERGEAIPGEVTAWETVCQSNDEFAEIRNQWIGATSAKIERPAAPDQ